MTSLPVATRESAAILVERQLGYDPSVKIAHKVAWHYGKEDLKRLLDYIYGGPPRTEAECLEPEIRGFVKNLRNR